MFGSTSRTAGTARPALRRLAVAALLCCTAGSAWSQSATPAGPAAITAEALRYANGEGVERDLDRAVVMLCTAADQGHGAAAYELGWLYLNGRGVPRNESLAAAWLREAAEHGEPAAARLLTRLHPASEELPWCAGSDGQPVRLANAGRSEVEAVVRRLAPRFGLDPNLVLAVIAAESDFNPQARSPKGALGLMQLIPATARRFGVSDPLEPLQNLRGGMSYLRWLLARFDGDVPLTLAGYNAGENAVERHGGIPPYTETQTYVRRILAHYGKRHHPVPTQSL